MVKISYAYKKNKVFLERERERERERENHKSHFIISFRNRPMRITNIIINTVHIARLF